MHWLLLILLLLGVLFGPGLWVRRTLARYDTPAGRYAGTGAELARHLLDLQGLGGVRVEETEQGDHFDPEANAVRLAPERFHGRSLTAVTVAAHEVGHAMQQATAYPPLLWRTRLVRLAQPAQRLGAALVMAAPLVAILTRAPLLSLLLVLGGFLSLGSAAVVHLCTLPTEFDASFRRALPLLRSETALYEADYPHARRILRAAALTYVAASLMSLLNMARWWALLRH